MIFVEIPQNPASKDRYHIESIIGPLKEWLPPLIVAPASL
jgi:hypothetical protein